jgi:hypothetical protein
MQDQIATIGMMIVKGVVVPVIGLFLAWAAAHAPAWAASKTKNERISGILSRLSSLTFQVVQEVQQTVVSKLGDKATAAELAAARDQALATLKSHLGDKGLQEIETVLGLQDQDAVIKMLITFIESAVHSLGKTDPVQPTSTPAVPAATATTA